LGCDYVDIYHHHGVSVRENPPFDEPVLKPWKRPKKRAKIRFIGISTHKNEPEVLQAQSIRKFLPTCLLNHLQFQQKHQAEIKEAIAKGCRGRHGVIVMKAMGSELQERGGKP